VLGFNFYALLQVSSFLRSSSREVSQFLANFPFDYGPPPIAFVEHQRPPVFWSCPHSPLLFSQRFICDLIPLTLFPLSCGAAIFHLKPFSPGLFLRFYSLPLMVLGCDPRGFGLAHWAAGFWSFLLCGSGHLQTCHYKFSLDPHSLTFFLFSIYFLWFTNKGESFLRYFSTRVLSVWSVRWWLSSTSFLPPPFKFWPRLHISPPPIVNKANLSSPFPVFSSSSSCYVFVDFRLHFPRLSVGEAGGFSLPPQSFFLFAFHAFAFAEQLPFETNFSAFFARTDLRVFFSPDLSFLLFTSPSVAFSLGPFFLLNPPFGTFGRPPFSLPPFPFPGFLNSPQDVGFMWASVFFDFPWTRRRPILFPVPIFHETFSPPPFSFSLSPAGCFSLSGLSIMF